MAYVNVNYNVKTCEQCRISHKVPPPASGTVPTCHKTGRPLMREHVETGECPLGRLAAAIPDDFDPGDYRKDAAGTDGCDCA